MGLKPADRGDDRGIGGRAAIDGASVQLRDGGCLGAGLAIHLPRHFGPVELGLFHLGADRAIGAAQIVAEPGNDERNAPQIRAERDEMAQWGVGIRPAIELVACQALGDAGLGLVADGADIIDKFAGARRQGDGTDHPLSLIHI